MRKLLKFAIRNVVLDVRPMWEQCKVSQQTKSSCNATSAGCYVINVNDDVAVKKEVTLHFTLGINFQD